MNINPIVAHLRKYATVFKGNVGGALDFEKVESSFKLPVPCAWVIYMNSSADETSPGSNVVRQEIQDYFSVYVPIRTAKEGGCEALIEILDEVRNQLFLTLVGWSFGDYSPIEFEGGAIEDIDRALVVYRYDFRAVRGLGRNGRGDAPETWQDYYLDGLPPLKEVDIDIDFIDPSATHEAPDGAIDSKIKLEFKQ